MGNAASTPGGQVSPQQREALEAVEKAMAKCNSTLSYLNTSAKVLMTKRDTSRASAVKAFRSGDKMAAVELLQKAKLAENDLRNIRQQQIAIEQQRSMIEQQQRNTRLTELLVETSAALHSANVVLSPSEQHPAEIVQQASEKMEAVYDAQAEISMSHREFGQIGFNAGLQTGSEAETTVSIEEEYAAELLQLAELSAASISDDSGKSAGPPASEPPLTVPSPPQTAPLPPDRSVVQSPVPARKPIESMI